MNKVIVVAVAIVSMAMFSGCVSDSTSASFPERNYWWR